MDCVAADAADTADAADAARRGSAFATPFGVLCFSSRSCEESDILLPIYQAMSLYSQ